VAKSNLSIIFGPPKDGEMPKGEGDDYSSDIPIEFQDACDLAFDAVKKGDRAGFCSALFDAFEAAEAEPHEEEDQPEEEPTDEEE
jgi:hypothetical protein